MINTYVMYSNSYKNLRAHICAHIIFRVHMCIKTQITSVLHMCVRTPIIHNVYVFMHNYEHIHDYVLNV